MSKFWRSLLLCVLTFALPLQSVAAVAMWHCLGSLNEAAPAVRAQVPQAHETHRHQHDAADSMEALDAEEDCHSHSAAADLGHQCSACAFCCLGHALPAAAPTLSTGETAAAPAVAPAVMVEGVCCDALERPPRLHLA